jgi:hypothetical protein
LPAIAGWLRPAPEPTVATAADLAFTIMPAAGGLAPVLKFLAVSRDGSRFYIPQAVEQPDSGVIHVKIGWVKQ